MNSAKHKFLWDDCESIEEQRARVFRRWLADPNGTYDERWNNERLVRLAIEFWVQSLFRRSDDKTLHEYWSDGITHFNCDNADITELHFSGTSIFSDRHANHEWLAPFELEIRYACNQSNVPSSLNLRFGRSDPVFRIARIPLGTVADRKKAALAVYSERPRVNQEWAVNLSLNPYDDG